jgi:predicted metal-binding transcription factor (methanogenesis marker protein 9)
MVKDADIPTKIVNVSSAPIAKKATVYFLRGPIPLPWLQRAASLPGKAYTLGSILWWFKGMNPTKPIKVTTKSLRNFSLSESAYLDGLKRLEEAGLVSVTRNKGQRALIEIIVLEDEAVRPPKAASS